MLKAEIIAIGSELLTPFRTDTNSLYLASRLEDAGIRLVAKTIVGDEFSQLVNAFRIAFERADVILCTGGLGPTVDDLTREALTEFLGIKMHMDAAVLEGIEARFKKRGMRMPEINRKQAMVPEGATVLNNPNGTAPGLYLDVRGKQIFLLPGPPPEMQPMWENSAEAHLKKDAPLERQIFRVAMLPESHVDQMLKPVSDSLKAVEYTILAAPGQIEIHLRAGKDATDELISAAAQVRAILGKHIYTEELEELEEVVGRLLIQSKKTIAVAESCTGGLLAHRLTQVPGSSAYFNRGIVAYHNDAKIEHLSIPAALIEANGAVSAPVAKAMAENVRDLAKSNFGIGITGIAGPQGGTPEKPVGTVFVALADAKETLVEKYNFPGQRDRIKFFSTQAALNLLRWNLLGI